MAFLQSIEETMREVEQAIVLFAHGHFGNVPHALAKFLGVGHPRIDKYCLETLLELPTQKRVFDPNDPEIYRVRARMILTLGLEKTLKEVERAIKDTVRRKFGQDEVRPLLRMGYKRSAPKDS